MKILRFSLLILLPLLFHSATGCGGGGGLGSTEEKLTGQWVAEKLNASGDRVMLVFNSGTSTSTTTYYGASSSGEGTEETARTITVIAIRPTGSAVTVDQGVYSIDGGKIAFDLTEIEDFESPFTVSTGTSATLTLGTEVYTKSVGELGGPVLGGKILVSDASVDQSVTTSSLKIKSTVPPFVPGELLILNPESSGSPQAGLAVAGSEAAAEKSPPYQVMRLNIEEPSSAGLATAAAPSSFSEAVDQRVKRYDRRLQGTWDAYQTCKPKCALNRILRTQSLSAPTDTSFGDQWNLNALDVTDSWGVATPVKDVVVAVIDTGIVDHPDLANRVLKKAGGGFQGYDFVHDKIDGIPDLDLDAPGPDPDPTDPGDHNTSLGLPGGNSWHGTHIAGIICAAIDNAVGIAGIATNCKILPIRAMGFEGNGTLSDVAQGIRYAAKLPNVAECAPFTAVNSGAATGGTYTYDAATWTCNIDPARPKANIINLSLGAPMTSAEASVLNSAIDDAYAQGVLVVAASGNEAKGPGWCINQYGSYYADPACAFYPAANPKVLSIGAVVPNLKFASSYSNYGGSPNTQFLVAPGGTGAQAILSTVNTSVLGGYAELRGTSQAAAHVSGVAAQVWSEIGNAPGLTDVQIRDKVIEALRTSAVDLGTPGRDVYFGWGLVGACDAVVKARPLAGLAPAAGGGAVHLSSTNVNFGPLATTHTAVIFGCGASPLTVQSATKHVNNGGSGWLTVGIVGATTPSILNLTVNRAGLSTGSYTATVTVNTSSGSQVLNVAMTVGSGGGTGTPDDDLRSEIEGVLGGGGGVEEKENTVDLGEVILLLIDAETGDAKWTTKTDFTADYNFQFGGFTPGKYYLLAGADQNNDGTICNMAETEPCFAYPNLASPEAFDVTTETRITDLVLNYAP